MTQPSISYDEWKERCRAEKKEREEARKRRASSAFKPLPPQTSTSRLEERMSGGVYATLPTVPPLRVRLDGGQPSSILWPCSSHGSHSLPVSTPSSRATSSSSSLMDVDESPFASSSEGNSRLSSFSSSSFSQPSWPDQQSSKEMYLAHLASLPSSVLLEQLVQNHLSNSWNRQ